jgi:hypothetical protein
MICTHLPLALLTSVFLIAPYALVHRRHLTRFALAAAAGIGLAAIYLLPALALDGYRDAAQLYKFPSWNPGYWSIYSFNWRDPHVAIIFVIVAVLGYAAARPAIRDRNPWAALALVLAVIVIGAIPFVWSLPLLSKVQFPYRALPIAEFGLATALARMQGRRALATAALPLLVSITVLHNLGLRRDEIAGLRTSHPDVYEYLPKGVMRPGQTSARLRDVLAVRLPPPRVPGMIVEPRFYFPAWSCSTMEPRTQLVMHAPSCTPRIVWTGAERLGAALSMLIALALAACSIARRRPEPR